MPEPVSKSSRELARLRAELRRLRTLERACPPLALLLKRRGFTIHKQKPSDDLLAPAPRHLDAYYRLLHKYSFRLLLRDVIKYQDSFTTDTVSRYATAEVTQGYLEHLRSMKILRERGGALALAKAPIRSFGTTLEWYVAELFHREFGAETTWGVRFKRPAVGGDYDVLARLDASLFYLEVKSSPPKQIYEAEVAAFLDRVDDLAPDVAVFLVDTELRMKDKIVPFFEQVLAARSAAPPPVERLGRELFGIGDRIYIVNAKEELKQNIGKVVERYYRKPVVLDRTCRAQKKTRGRIRG